jgi:hypothetical protein
MAGRISARPRRRIHDGHRASGRGEARGEHARIAAGEALVESAWGGFAPPGIKLKFEATGPASKPAPTGPRKDVYSDPSVRKVMDAVDGGIIHVEQDRP